MFKLAWSVFKYFVLLPIFLFLVYFGALLPVSRCVSLLDVPETLREGCDAFAQFGDFCAKHVRVYRAYYNAWLPDGAHIEGEKVPVDEEPRAL